MVRILNARLYMVEDEKEKSEKVVLQLCFSNEGEGNHNRLEGHGV